MSKGARAKIIRVNLFLRVCVYFAYFKTLAICLRISHMHGTCFSQIYLSFSPLKFHPHLPYWNFLPASEALSLFKYPIPTASVYTATETCSMGSLSGPVFLKKTDSPSPRSHQWPNSSSDGMGFHDVSPLPSCVVGFWLAWLCAVLCMQSQLLCVCELTLATALSCLAKSVLPLDINFLRLSTHFSIKIPKS